MTPLPIWHPDPHPFVDLKTSLRVAGSRRRGWVRCACSGPFQLFLDGGHVGSGPGGELTQVPAWDRFEIDADESGEHSVLIVRAAAGPSAGWFICEGEISGSSAVTDQSWSSHVSTSADSEFSEKHTATLDPCHNETERAAAWAPCVPVDWAPTPANLPPSRIAMIEVEAREVLAYGEIDALRLPAAGSDPSPLTRCKCVHPDGLLQGQRQHTTIRTPQARTGACVILDFGRQVCGTPFLSLQTVAAGGAIDLFFGTRREDGFDTAVRYICREGRQQWTGLTSHSCRYLLVRFSGFVEHDCAVERLGVHLRRTEGPTAEPASAGAGRPGSGSDSGGGAISGDEQLEALWAVGRSSTEACRQQVYRLEAYPAPYDWLRALPHFLNDCCQRGDTTAARAMLVSTGVIPQGRELDLRRWLGYPLFVEAYLQHSGDRATVAEVLTTVISLLQRVQERLHGSGPLPADGGWSATRVTILAAGAAGAAARLFDAFAMRPEREQAESCFESLSASVLPCWSPAAHLFDEGEGEEGPGYTQLTNALALLFGLADETKQQEIIAAMRGAGVERARLLADAFFVTAGYWEAGAHKRAMQCLQTHWGRLCDREGPTWLDKHGRKADGDGAAPGPDYFLASRVVGVRPATPGHETIEIEPPSVGLVRMRAELPTANGRVRVEWWRHESQRTCRVEVQMEHGTRARLCMPRSGLRFPEITINDETVWRNDKVVPNPWVHDIVDEPERIILSVSGTRSFTAYLS